MMLPPRPVRMAPRRPPWRLPWGTRPTRWRAPFVLVALGVLLYAGAHVAVVLDTWPAHGVARRARAIVSVDVAALVVWALALLALARLRYRGSVAVVTLPLVLFLLARGSIFGLLTDPAYLPDPGVARAAALAQKTQRARAEAVRVAYDAPRRTLVDIAPVGMVDTASIPAWRGPWLPRSPGVLAPMIAPAALLLGVLLARWDRAVRALRDHRRIALAIAIGAVVVLSFGFTTGGRVGNRTPWELFLVAFVVVWAATLGDDAHNLMRPSPRRPLVLARLVAYGAAPVMLFVLLPGTRDLGIAVVLASSLAAMLIVGTRQWRWLVFMGAVWLLLVALAFRFDERSATRLRLAYEPYRELAGLDTVTARRWAEKVHQIKLFDANVLAGGFLGAGPGRGHAETAPNAADDGFMTTFAAEWGLAGAVALVTTYVLFLLSLLTVAAGERGTFERSLVVGLTMLIAMPFWLAALGDVRVMPLTGVAAAFIAHGGSKLIASSFAVGVVAAISHRQRRDAGATHGSAATTEDGPPPPWVRA